MEVEVEEEEMEAGKEAEERTLPLRGYDPLTLTLTLPLPLPLPLRVCGAHEDGRADGVVHPDALLVALARDEVGHSNRADAHHLG